MNKLEWDKTGERLYETGIDKGVLFLLNYGRYSKGEAWSGLINVTEKPSGAEPNAFYANNHKYLNLVSVEDLALGVEAYTYPDDFRNCLGVKQLAKGVYAGQQKRQHFGFVYRTLIGNDIEDTDFGYEIKIVFDCCASPSENAHNTINETPEPGTMSWELSTTTQSYQGCKPTAMLTLSSKDFAKAGLWNVLKSIEDILFGTATTDSRLPKIPEILDMFELQMYLRDSSNETITDSAGNNIQTRVFA